jgi:hypothetical protein
MKIKYRHYKPDQGLEEIRAKIYTNATGLPANADQIRIQAEGRDPKLMRFAFSDEGKPLAYISASGGEFEPWSIGMGYPWALPGCPKEAQDKIFEDLFEYLKRQKKIQEIYTNVSYRNKIHKEQIRFFLEKGFTEKERYFVSDSDLDVTEVAKWGLTKDIKGLKARKATHSDRDALIELCLSDPQTRGAFPTHEAWVSYFDDRVLKAGHAVMVFKGSELVAASAPLRYKPDGVFLTGKGERTIMRFTGIRPGYTYAWKRLLIEVAKECVKAKWTDIPIRVSWGISTTNYAAPALMPKDSEFKESGIVLFYTKR